MTLDHGAENEEEGCPTERRDGVSGAQRDSKTVADDLCPLGGGRVRLHGWLCGENETERGSLHAIWKYCTVVVLVTGASVLRPIENVTAPVIPSLRFDALWLR